MTSCDHPEPCVLVTTKEAAETAGVQASTIRAWKRRGWITDRGARGRSLTYCLQDIRTAEVREQRRIQGYA